MSKKKSAKCLFAVIRAIFLTPIWYYIWWSILMTISAPSILFYLFWSYVPISFIIILIEVVTDNLLEENE